LPLIPPKTYWTYSIAKKPHTSNPDLHVPRRSAAGDKKEPEYRLLVTPHLAERTQQFVTRIILETTKTFATFRYELSVGEKIVPGAILISVLGFKTPHLTLPQSGPARFQRDYEGLKGTYALTIEGIDRRSTTFSVRISMKKVDLIKSPRNTFVQLITDAARWTSPTS
jgi:hypothetical protein